MGHSQDAWERTPAPEELSAVTVADREHHLAAPARTIARLERILSPNHGRFADWHERGAICVLTESTGVERTTLLIHDVVMPERGDLTAPSDGDRQDLEFNPQYKRRARRVARSVRGLAGLLYVHTHPKPASGTFSSGDRFHDRAQLYQEVKHLGEDVPLAAAVVHEGEDPWRVWRYEFRRARTAAQKEQKAFGPSSVERSPITAIRVVDAALEKRTTKDGEEHFGPATARGRLNAAQQDSTITLWGKDGQRRFAGLRVGIVGCGGGGSILVAVLASLGIGELVLVDFDRVKPVNANRHLSVKEEEIEERRAKVEVSARVAREAATCPDFEVTPVVGSVFEEDAAWAEYDALSKVLDCDLLMNAADPHTVRCTVSRLAYAHLIPVVDAGSRLRAKDGQLTNKSRSKVAVAGPGNPCLRCAGQWTDSGYQKDLTGKGPEQGYADEEVAAEGNDDTNNENLTREPSAMPINLLTMGLACQRLLHLVQGLSPGIAVGAASFRLDSWNVGWENYGTNQLRSCRSRCNRSPVALGDGADLKRGPDLKLRDERGDDSPRPSRNREP